jgi:uncharacterized membrane protein YphA (DoxX/SURF4 family)
MWLSLVGFCFRRSSSSPASDTSRRRRSGTPPSKACRWRPCLVPASGVMAVAGGLSILVGYYARVGAVLVAVFLVPVTLALHRFWAETDPMMAQLQLAMFLKNVSMLGGALIVSHFGAGPASIDASRHRPTAGARRPHAA